MTEKEAREIINRTPGTYISLHSEKEVAKVFLAGLESERKRSERLVYICNKLKRLHAFFPDALLFHELEKVLAAYSQGDNEGK